jgi:pimeloyl-ACP methyl ester carboxylesterase
MIHIRTTLGLALLSFFAVAVMAGHAPLLWGDLQPGPFRVGFTVKYARDTSRPWLPTADKASDSSDPGRPIRIAVWYPAGESSAQPMVYGDYLHHDGPADFHDLNETLEKSDIDSWTSDLKEVSPSGGEIAGKLFRTPVAARRDAAPALGEFPLVLYSGGLGSRADANVELGEYLASHGFVMATVPQLGASSDNLGLGGSPKEVELHALDLEFALSELQHDPHVDTRNVAVVGHSAGGIVALYIAARNRQIRAMVGLDGSYGFRGSLDRMKSLHEFYPQALNVPILDLRRADGVQGAHVDLDSLRTLTHSDRYIVTFKRMFHGDFTEFAPIGEKLNVPLPPNNDGRTRTTGFLGNQQAYRALLLFLEATLKHRHTNVDKGIRRAVLPVRAEVTHMAPRRQD